MIRFTGFRHGDPEKLLVTINFVEQGPGKTRLTVQQSGMPFNKERELAEQGWDESLDKLETGNTNRATPFRQTVLRA